MNDTNSSEFPNSSKMDNYDYEDYPTDFYERGYQT